jgi:WD40 repeat protein
MRVYPIASFSKYLPLILSAILFLSASHSARPRTQSGELLHRLGDGAAGGAGHSARVHSVAFHPTQPWVLTAGADGLLKMFH